jgi:AcrR family transcriptional regulator
MVRDRPAELGDARGQVLAAATRLFAAHGFDGTPLQAIADALGVTKAAVLHHFRSKEELRAAVLGAIVEHWQKVLPDLLVKATASEDRFESVLGELHRFFAAEPDRALLIVRETLDRPNEVRRILRGPLRPWLSAIAGYIEAGRRHGTHQADVDPEAYVMHILLLCVSAASVAGVCAAAFEGAGARTRWDRELHRIARASLFSPRPKRRRS